MRTSSGEFSVQQDNWVYAPNGGMWTISGSNKPVGLQPLTAKAFISPKLLVEATCKLLPDSSNYEVYTCYTKEDIDAVMAKLIYTDPSAEAEFKESISKFASGGGFLIALVAFIPGVKEVSLVSHILFYGGEVTSSIGMITWISDVIEEHENKRIIEVITDGNLSITSSHFAGGSMRNVWHAWETAPYINKFQLERNGTIYKNISADDVKVFCGW